MAYVPIGDAVLYNNHHLVAFNKPAGLPVQPDQTEDPSLLQLGSVYCRRKLQLIHRVDRPVSGVVLLAKKPEAQRHLHQQFRERTTRKTYLALTANPPDEEEGELVHYLKKQGRGKRVRVLQEAQAGAQEARLRYRLAAQSERYYLLQVELLTGRYHQIRAQLSHIGCPIRGDVKYGFRRRNPDRSIDLHAWQLEFAHPISGQREKIIAPPPDSPLWQAFDLSSLDVGL